MVGKIVFFIVSLILSGLTCYLASLMRASGIKDKRINGLYTLYLALPCWIILCAATAIAQPGYYAAFFTAKVVCAAVIPYMTLWFVLHFVESKLAGSRTVLTIFVAIVGIDILMLLTNPLHGLYYTSFDTVPPVQGIFPQVHVVLSVLIILFVYALLLQYIIKNYKRDPVLILTGFGAVIPIILNIIHRYGLFGGEYDFSALGYFFTIVIYTYAAYGYRFRKAKPGQLSGTLARIAKSHDITAGSIEDAACLITWESCIALDTYRVSVWRFEEETQTMINLISFDSTTGEYSIQAAFDINHHSAYRDLLETERIAVVKDTKNPALLYDFFEDYDPDICAVIDVAIIVDGKLAGRICVEQNRCNAFPERREWSQDEQSFVSTLADLMALSISNNERRASAWRLESQLSKSVGFSNTAIQYAPIGITMFDEDFNVLFCNDAATSMFEISKSYYRSNYQTISPEYQPDGSSSREKWESLMERAKKDKKVKFEWTCRTHSGKLIPCEVTVLTLMPGDNQNILAYVYDISEIKKMQEKIRKSSEDLEAALRNATDDSSAKTEFLAKMSQNMRTPMDALAKYTELALESGDDPKKMKQHVLSIKKTGADLQVIVDNILEFTEIISDDTK